MHAILKKLEGGDRRSIGRVKEVVTQVLESPVLFDELIKGLSVSDPIVVMRAADALEKISLLHPEYLWPYRKFLLELAQGAEQKEVRWHLAQMLPRLKLNQKETQHVVDVLLTYFSDNSSIVKTCAMQALADIACQSEVLRPIILLHLRELAATGTPAMKARSRKLFAQLESLGYAVKLRG